MSAPQTPFDWPEWVPEKARADIESFWTCFNRNGGDDWRASARQNDAPALGARVLLHELMKPMSEPPTAFGRFVFAWNNIGRIVTDDGRLLYVSFSRPSLPPRTSSGKRGAA